MGDVQEDALAGAVDEVIATLKTESLRNDKKKAEIEKMIDTLSDEDFNSLVLLGQ